MPKHETPKVLVIDDDIVATDGLIAAMSRRSAPFVLHSANTPEDGLRFVGTHTPEVVVVDLEFNGSGPQRGLDLIRAILQIDHTIRVIVLTGHVTGHIGITAIENGASSFLGKPLSLDLLYQLIVDGINYTNLRRSYEETPSSTEAPFGNFIAKSPSMIQVLHDAAFAATNLQPLLIVGETGTGKGVIANAIHSRGTQRRGSFVRYCPGVSDRDLTNSELFGHTRGAFTGAHDARAGLIEEAHNGTLFLDEVDEMPNASQVSLLHTLQERRFRRLGSNKEIESKFRLICATNRPVSESLGSGKLRQDFYHRIGHFIIELPPLRERIEDIVEIAERSLIEIVNRDKLPRVTLSHSSKDELTRYHWPGNLRELNSVITRGAHLASYKHRLFVEPNDLFPTSAKHSIPSHKSSNFRHQVRSFEQQLITEALKRHGNNQSLAARELGLDRSTLRRILAR